VSGKSVITLVSGKKKRMRGNQRKKMSKDEQNVDEISCYEGTGKV
jgi:hypothetical protein